MTIKSTGKINFSELQTEFGGSNPVSMSEYYRGGTNVPNANKNTSIPISGKISTSNFYNTSKTTVVTYEIIGGGGAGGRGVDDRDNNTRGTYGGSGGTSSLSASGISTITAPGGSGGENTGGGNAALGGAGESSYYGVGGGATPLNTDGYSAPATSYGAGGAGGGGDDGGYNDQGGYAGLGGSAGIRAAGTFTIIYGTTLTINIGLRGVPNPLNVNWDGGYGAGGYCKITYDGNSYIYTASSTKVII